MYNVYTYYESAGNEHHHSSFYCIDYQLSGETDPGPEAICQDDTGDCISFNFDFVFYLTNSKLNIEKLSWGPESCSFAVCFTSDLFVRLLYRN